MRVRALLAAGVGVLAVLAAATLAPSASATTSRSAAGRTPSAGNQSLATADQITAAKQKAGCRYRQTRDDTRGAVHAQSWGEFYYDLDSEGIDDFKCNSKKPTVDIKAVTVWGQNHGENDFFRFKVTIYNWNHGAPGGGMVCEMYSNDKTESAGPPGSIKYRIRSLAGCTLTRNEKYWLDVQAQANCMDYCPSWSWELLKPSAYGPAYWRNPDDGYGLSCPDWGTISDCITHDGVAYDLAFAI